MDKRFGKVAVLMGGSSAERSVSLKSGQAVLDALLRQGVDAIRIDADLGTLNVLQKKKIDRVFIALHGRWGEDGVIQGGLESIGLPYTGAGVMACAIAMDKCITKHIWRSHGLPTARFRTAYCEQDLEGVIEELGLPLYVKASREGSSVGVVKVTKSEDLLSAWHEARKYDEVVLIEQFNSGDELTIGILAGKALPVIRIKVANEFYDFQAKYESDETQYLCPAGLSDKQEQEIKALAEQSFAVIDGRSDGNR